MVSSSIFKVFGMTRPGIEPRSPGPLANTLTAGPMSRLYNEEIMLKRCFFLFRRIKICLCPIIWNIFLKSIRQIYAPIHCCNFIRWVNQRPFGIVLIHSHPVSILTHPGTYQIIQISMFAYASTHTHTHTHTYIYIYVYIYIYKLTVTKL